MSFKCDNTHCPKFEGTERLIKCNGICKKNFHGPCIGLLRNWKESRLSNAFIAHFICEACVTACNAVSSIMEELENTIVKQNDELTELTRAVRGTIRENSEKFETLCNEYIAYRAAFDGMSQSISDIVNKYGSNTETLNVIRTEESTNDISNQLNRLSGNIELLLNNKRKANKTGHQDCNTNNSGWRNLDGKSIWKRDWSEYDKKVEVRHAQEKARTRKLNKMRRNKRSQRNENEHEKQRRNKQKQVGKQNGNRNRNRNPVDINDFDNILNEFHNFNKIVRYPNFTRNNSFAKNSSVNNNDNFKSKSNFNENVFYRSNNIYNNVKNKHLNEQNCCHRNNNYNEDCSNFLQNRSYNQNKRNNNNFNNNNSMYRNQQNQHNHDSVNVGQGFF